MEKEVERLQKFLEGEMVGKQTPSYDWGGEVTKLVRRFVEEELKMSHTIGYRIECKKASHSTSYEIAFKGCWIGSIDCTKKRGEYHHGISRYDWTYKSVRVTLHHDTFLDAITSIDKTLMELSKAQNDKLNKAKEIFKEIKNAHSELSDSELIDLITIIYNNRRNDSFKG